MSDAFQSMIDNHRARLKLLRETLVRDDHPHAVSECDLPSRIALVLSGLTPIPIFRKHYCVAAGVRVGE